MTITPTFHFVCRYCGDGFQSYGERITGSGVHFGWQLMDAQIASLDKAKCLEDVCRQCMPIHAKSSQDHDEMKASRCPIEEPDL